MPLTLERSPTTYVPPDPSRFRRLLRDLLSIDVPDGYRAEIVGESIVLSPWPPPHYLLTMRAIESQLAPLAPDGHVLTGTPCLFTFPAQERAVQPEMYAVDRSAFHTDAYHLDGRELSLAVELTCPATRHHDYGDKLATYGQAGVPVYLLADMEEQRTTVFWEPGEDGYAERESARFGEELRVPAFSAREPGAVGATPLKPPRTAAPPAPAGDPRPPSGGPAWPGCC
ncbi:Uma2 family endonuclease [Streptomyces sp. NPDC017056]|uniref:Uma2 family endonuclease n=1 Tax=Streptomyces sp. NPDC017056 TaxID=3364973 RepID=UPI0037B8A41B